MFNAKAKNDDEATLNIEDGSENHENYTGSEDEEVTRKGTFRILNTSIVYDSDDEVFNTVATCINEKNKIETISIDGFEILSEVKDLAGANIDYQEFFEDGEQYYSGKIYNS